MQHLNLMTTGPSMIPSAGRKGPLPAAATLFAVLTRPGRLTPEEASAFLDKGYPGYFAHVMRRRRAARANGGGDANS